MKKMKKLLCMLLAFVMMASSLAVGATAYESYTSPAGYNSLGKPVFSYEQSCSMLLDWLDTMLYDMNINEEIDIVVAKINLNLTSINNTYDSLCELMDMSLVSVADTLSLLGDITDLSVDAIRSPRRASSASATDGTKDSLVFYALLEFLYDNSTILANLVNGSLDMGILPTFLAEEDYPYLYDLPNFLKEQIYIILYNSFFKADSEADIEALPEGVTVDSFTIDGLLQDLVDSLLIGEYNVSTQSYTGLLPSMQGKTSITVGSTYDLLQNLIDSLMADILVPMLVESLPDALSIETSAEWPNGNPEAPGLLPTVVGVINDMLGLGYEYDEEEYPIIELEKLANWLLVGEEKVNSAGDVYKTQAALYDIISFTSHGIDINDSLMNTLGDLLRSLGPGLIQMIFSDEISEEDIEGINWEGTSTDVFISNVVKMIAPFALPDVRFLPDCDTVQECLTYILISFVIDILPENDYYGWIENGTLDPEDGAWIEVGVDYLIYLVNSLIDINIPATASLDEFISYLADWLIANYGFIFNTRQNYAGMTGWEKLDNTLFNVLDPTLLTINISNGKTVSESLIVDTLLKGIQEFNIEKILSFLGKNGTSDAVLNLSLVEFIIDLLSRVLSGLMNGNVVIPERVTRLETLIVGEGGVVLGEFVKNLLVTLYTEREYNFTTLIPLIGQLIGLSINDNYTVYAPTGYANKSINDLKKLMAQYKPSNGDLQYYEDGYFTMGEEDYEYLYEYDDFADTYSDCEDLVELYNTAPYEVTSLDIKNLYYRLGYYYDRLTARSELCKLQLFREIEYANKNNVTSNFLEDGTQIYTDRSWRLYQEALANAQAVYASDSVKQSQISKARQELFKSQNALKEYIGLARYTLLDYNIERAKAISTDDYKLYTTNTLSAFTAAYDAAVKLDRDYDQDDQDVVDAASNALQMALANLTLWEINYELGADIVIDSVVAQDANTVLKFRESSGAAVTDVVATVNNGATIGEVYMEGDYYCWEVAPGSAPLYSVITATISFTQPSTGKSYKAQAYTFVSAGKEIVIDVNTCQPGYIRNPYTLSVHGINDTSLSEVTYHVDHTSGTDAGYMSSIPTGMIYVDTSLYSDLSQVPGLMFTITKDASTYEAGYIGSGNFAAVNVEVVTSDESLTVDPSSYSMTVYQTDVKNFKFAGRLPDPGASVTTLVTANVTATATNGGATISHPQFYLRVNAYDKSSLRATVADAIAACRQEWFYSGGWDIYKRDLEDAVYILNNPLVTQAQIDEANDNLKEAVTFLEYKTADYKELHKLISIANSLDPYDYKDFSGVVAVLNKIEYNQDLLSQSLIDTTVDELRAAIDSLVPAQGQIYIRCYDKSGAAIADDTVTEVAVEGESTVTLISTDIIHGNVGERVLINVPQIMGYSSTDKQQLVTITNDGVVVEFYYTADEYTVRLNANGGKVESGTVTVTYGSTYADLPVPTRTGYEFVGWYTKLTGGMKIDENTKVTTSYYKTLYAHWEDAVETESSDVVTDSADTSVETNTQVEEELTIFDMIFAALSQLIGLLLSNVFGIG